MKSIQLFFSLFFWLPSAVFARVTTRDDDTDFKLYAYGTGIGGLPVFYYQGTAYIGDLNTTASSLGDGAVPVTFHDSSGVWTVTPDNSTQSISNGTFYVPGPGTGGGPGGFLNSTSPNTTSSIISSGWSFYGQVAILALSDGSWVTNFYAAPSEFDDVYTLEWNVTDTTTDIPVSIKKTAPSNPTS